LPIKNNIIYLAFLVFLVISCISFLLSLITYDEYKEFDSLDHSGKLAISDHTSVKSHNPNTITNYAVISSIADPVGRIICMDISTRIITIELEFCKIIKVNNDHYQIDICDGQNLIDYYGDISRTCGISNLGVEI
jgi:hypothetical protein